MAELKGTNVAGIVVPFTTADKYATHDAKYGKGGWREVADITERNAISDDRLTIGMAVYVLSENKLYIYKGTETDPDTQVVTKVWEEFTSGISGVAWGDITGTLEDQADLNAELTGLGERIDGTEEDISDIQSTIDGYGDIVTHNAAEFQPAGDYATTGELDDLSDIVDQEIQDRQDADDTLQEQIDNLKARGRFLSLWNATTGLAETNPETSPYSYNSGDYFIVGTVGETNYKPTGTQYVIGQPSTEVETEELATDDAYYFDGTVWHLQKNHGKTVSFANLAGSPDDNIALKQALDAKQDTISDLDTIRANATAGKTASDTIATYGDIVTHNANEFQPVGDYATNTALNQGLDTKQDKTDNNLITTSKTVVGAINEIDEKIEDIEAARFPNAIIIGEPTILQGQVSNFSEANYLQFPFLVDLTNRRFRIEFCFTTGNDVTTQQNILDSQFGLALAISNGKGLMAISHNGTSWAGAVVGTLNIQPNTTYYAKLSWNRINYQTQLSTDGSTFTPDMNFGSTQSPYPRTMFIGGCSGSAIGHTAHPFKGTINLNKCYLYIEDVEVWQGMDDIGLATRADISLDNLDAKGEARFNAKQNVLTPGAGITIEDDTISANINWGDISGNILNQEDLAMELNSKQDSLPDGEVGKFLTKTADGVEWNTAIASATYDATTKTIKFA